MSTENCQLRELKPLIIAHRGGALEAFENSFSAFKHAIKIGCDSIEVDLRATKDKKIVILHDPTLNRTTTGRGKLDHYTIKALKRFRLRNGEPIPTLEALLRLVGKKISLHLEVKESGFEAALVKILEKFKCSKRVYVISFNRKILEKIHRLDLGLRTGFLFSEKNEWNNTPKFCTLVMPKASLLTKTEIQALKAKQKEIHTWVVNDPKTAARLASLGVAGIATDAPGFFVRTHTFGK